MPTEETQEEPLPECPYNCPYKPSKDERPDNDYEAEEVSIDEESCPAAQEKIDKEIEVMSAIIRETDHESKIHFKKVWDTQYGPKVGVRSTKEASHVFDKLEWNRSHHRWNSDRVTDTDMWELDLDALFYVAAKFFKNDIDVTIDDEILELYLQSQDGESLDI